MRCGVDVWICVENKQVLNKLNHSKISHEIEKKNLFR